jgi:hypothetical protein
MIKSAIPIPLQSGGDGFREGLNPSYVLGMRNEDSHAWLSKGDLVIDVTDDQFN